MWRLNDAGRTDWLARIRLQKRHELLILVNGSPSGAVVTDPTWATSAKTFCIAWMQWSGKTVVKAEVPMAEMLTYGADLTSMTQGRGSYSMDFSHYDIVPQQIADKIVAEARAAGHGKEEAE